MKKYLDLIVFAVLLLLVIVLPKDGVLNSIASILTLLSAIYVALKRIVSRGIPFFKKLP